ncbi:MAG: iron complex outermembrane receptor protein [Patiriisocius sp.]|jgi:iron complex outermembrane receptor protein
MFSSIDVHAQFSISGKIESSEDLPIHETSIKIDEGTTVYYPDSDGNYSITVEEGLRRIEFRNELFEIQIYKLNIKKDTNLDVVMITISSIMDEVVVRGLRESELSPMSYSEVSKEEIAERNLGQDLPILLNYLPSVVTTSDAGTGIGYTGMRVRGSDATRVNVTINGVPYNDSESQGTFWVDLPDFASSVESIQLVRGVGSSTNGSGAFGANLSLVTDGVSKTGGLEINSSFGSFNTRKSSVNFDTGLLNEKFNFIGRLSRIKSDGYVDRASADLSAYFTQLSYMSGKTLIKALAFGGVEETYQSWDGIDQFTIESDRTFNWAGVYYDEDGTERFYDNQVDNYSQDHYQLILSQKLNDKLNFNLTGHYTWGRGYYEQFKEDEPLADYDLQDIISSNDTIQTTDLVRRKWLDNDFYGAISSLTYTEEKLESTLGISYNQYRGDHFGEVIWAKFASNGIPRTRYYDNFGNKDELNVFLKNTYNLNSQMQLFADLQYRTVTYNADGVSAKEVDDSFDFFNPKVGLSYKLNNDLFYVSYAIANREPSRSDYENGNPEPEQLGDLELGYKGVFGNSKMNANIYVMNYNNQLVLTGELDEDFAPIRTNVGKSTRMGLELDADLRISNRFRVMPNVTFSSNENKDYNIETDVDGENVVENLGDTKISFSPELVCGNRVSYQSSKGFHIDLLTKFVSEQYMGNVEAPLSLLESYFVNDLLFKYEIKPKNTFKTIGLSLLINNILDEEYESNGYWGPGYVGYYPQAGTNFLLGVNLKF